MPVEHRLRLAQYSERPRRNEALHRDRAKVDAIVDRASRRILWREAKCEAEREASAAVAFLPEENAMRRLAEGSRFALKEPHVVLAAALKQGDVAVEDEKARGRVAAQLLDEGEVVPPVRAALERVQVKADGRGRGDHHYH